MSAKYIIALGDRVFVGVPQTCFDIGVHFSEAWGMPPALNSAAEVTVTARKKKEQTDP